MRQVLPHSLQAAGGGGKEGRSRVSILVHPTMQPITYFYNFETNITLNIAIYFSFYVLGLYGRDRWRCIISEAWVGTET